MSILGNADQQKIRKLQGDLSQARRELAICERDRDSYLAQLEGRKDLMWWAHAKCRRQSSALDDLNRRTTTLRFGVKVMEQILGRPVTREEWVAARSLVADEQHRDRIDAEPVSA